MIIVFGDDDDDDDDDDADGYRGELVHSTCSNIFHVPNPSCLPSQK